MRISRKLIIGSSFLLIQIAPIRLNELVTLFTYNLTCFCYPLRIQLLEIVLNHQDTTKIKNVSFILII